MNEAKILLVMTGALIASLLGLSVVSISLIRPLKALNVFKNGLVKYEYAAGPETVGQGEPMAPSFSEVRERLVGAITIGIHAALAAAGLVGLKV